MTSGGVSNVFILANVSEIASTVFLDFPFAEFVHDATEVEVSMQFRLTVTPVLKAEF